MNPSLLVPQVAKGSLGKTAYSLPFSVGSRHQPGWDQSGRQTSCWALCFSDPRNLCINPFSIGPLSLLQVGHANGEAPHASDRSRAGGSPCRFSWVFCYSGYVFLPLMQKSAVVTEKPEPTPQRRYNLKWALKVRNN